MMHNKTLLLFPILVSVLSVFIFILFMMPVAFQRTGYGLSSADHWKAVGNSIYSTQPSSGNDAGAPANAVSQRVAGIKPIALIYFVIMYFVSMFAATFLNVAFYREILNALRGEPVSIMGGLQFAATKWKIILMWTLFAGVVGFIIKTLEQRFGFFGQIIMKLIGAVWSIACVFVIPVIVTEQETANPFAVLKKSAQTLTKTWGESLTGYVGVSMGGSIIMLLSFVWLGSGIVLAVVLHSILLGVAAVLSWLLFIIVFSYLIGVASQIFRCALFLYASQGALPHPYTEEMMALAWKTKKR